MSDSGGVNGHRIDSSTSEYDEDSSSFIVFEDSYSTHDVDVDEKDSLSSDSESESESENIFRASGSDLLSESSCDLTAPVITPIDSIPSTGRKEIDICKASLQIQNISSSSSFASSDSDEDSDNSTFDNLTPYSLLSRGTFTDKKVNST